MSDTPESINNWDTDHADTLARNESSGEWFKRFTPVPAACIIASEPLTPAHVKQLVEALNAKA